MRERTGLSQADIARRVDALVVTLGGEGSRIYADGFVLDIPSVKPAALVDPTGCGDAYRAGLLYGIAHGWDWQQHWPPRIAARVAQDRLAAADRTTSSIERPSRPATPRSSAPHLGSAARHDALARPMTSARANRRGAALARTPLPLRLVRYLRVSLHVFQGVATTAFVFPMVALPRRRTLIQRWSARLLAMLNVESRTREAGGGCDLGNVLIVANHVSWLDIFVLNTIAASPFHRKVGAEGAGRW